MSAVLASSVGRTLGQKTLSKKLSGRLVMHLIAKILLIGGTALDSHSSWHQREANPILASQGRYGHKGIAINVALTGAVLGIGIWRERKHPEERRRIAVMEGALGGFKVGTAVRNYRVR